jgi:molybdopterin-biosynthesis enzyme MoeA-like protein
VITACLLAIGNELLCGEIRDLNLHYLSRQLTQLGFYIHHAMMTRDDAEHIGDALKFLLTPSPDLLICSGGLGPTLDDLTLSVIAKIFNRPLSLNTEAQMMVKDQYDSLIKKGYLDQYGPEQARIKMATIPQLATPIRNPIGTAPGIYLRLENTDCYFLPGIPKELDAIFNTTILAALHASYKLSHWAESALLVHCDDEAELATALGEMTTKYPAVYIKSLAKPFPTANRQGIRVIATTHADSKVLAEEMVRNVLSELHCKLASAGFIVEDNVQTMS